MKSLTHPPKPQTQAHLKTLETPSHSVSLLTGLEYLVRISEVPDNEIFKICLDYWHLLAADLYESENKGAPVPQPLQIGGAGFQRKMQVRKLRGHEATYERNSDSSLRFAIYLSQYQKILSGVRMVMISRMAKPEEVLIVEDENGDVVRETTKDTELLAQYKTMKECLVYLTHLNYDDTETIMLQKLSMQVDGTQWSWNNLNTLCWGIGSISGAMNEEEEVRGGYVQV